MRNIIKNHMFNWVGIGCSKSDCRFPFMMYFVDVTVQEATGMEKRFQQRSVLKLEDF